MNGLDEQQGREDDQTQDAHAPFEGGSVRECVRCDHRKIYDVLYRIGQITPAVPAFRVMVRCFYKVPLGSLCVVKYFDVYGKVCYF